MQFIDDEFVSNFDLLPKDKKELVKIIDLINKSTRNYDKKFSNFLRPSISSIIKKYINIDDFNLSFLGNERQIMSIYPFYEELKIKDYPIKALKLSYNKKFSNIGHRDVLGTLMSLGIKRDNIGDIAVFDEKTFIVVKKDIFDYLRINFRKIKNTPINIKEISYDEINFPEKRYKNIKTTLNTNRVDAIISKGFGINRKSAKKFIKNNKVKVNHFLISKAYKDVEKGDIISVKGKGRLILSKKLGLSNKDRLKVIIKKLI
ncbi:MAG: RNA-binding protein [Bacillota bacterium]